MCDYLNLAIYDPDRSVTVIDSLPDDKNLYELNRRRYDFNEGTIIHMVICGLLESTDEIFYNDETACILIRKMVEKGASITIENSEELIPYELFKLFCDNPFDYKTYRFLLYKTTELILEDEFERDLYNGVW